MPTFYRGAPPGSYWHTHDAQLNGFTAKAAGMGPSTDVLIRHIANGITDSPYISLTWSPGVARDYAILGSGTVATPHTPGYVYVIDIPNPLPSHLQFQLLDPIREIAPELPQFPSFIPYQHEGDQNFLLGVVKPSQFRQHLLSYRLGPSGLEPPQPATSSLPLIALVNALRDAEVLAVGALSRNCITRRIDVY